MCDCRSIHPHPPNSTCPCQASQTTGNAHQRQHSHCVDDNCGQSCHIHFKLSPCRETIYGQERTLHSQPAQHRHHTSITPATITGTADLRCPRSCGVAYRPGNYTHDRRQSHARNPPTYDHPCVFHEAFERTPETPPSIHVDHRRYQRLKGLEDLIKEIANCDIHHPLDCCSHPHHDPDHDPTCALLCDIQNYLTVSHNQHDLNNHCTCDPQTQLQATDLHSQLQDLLSDLEAETHAAGEDGTGCICSQLRQFLPCNEPQNLTSCMNGRRQQQQQQQQHASNSFGPSSTRRECCNKTTTNNGASAHALPCISMRHIHECTHGRSSAVNGCRNATAPVPAPVPTPTNPPGLSAADCIDTRMPPFTGRGRRMRDLTGIRGLWC